MKRSTTCILIFASFIFCERSNSHLESQYNIQGTWVETFPWIDIFNCIQPEDDSSLCEVNQISTLIFSDSSFSVKIGQTKPTIQSYPNTFYVGSYQLLTDIIVFRFDDRFMNKMVSGAIKPGYGTSIYEFHWEYTIEGIGIRKDLISEITDENEKIPMLDRYK